MKHLLKNGRCITYLHSIYGNLWKVNKPIDEIIDFVEKNTWRHRMQDVDWKEFCPDLERIDLIFNSNKIRHNFHNEWVLLQMAKEQC